MSDHHPCMLHPDPTMVDHPRPRVRVRVLPDDRIVELTIGPRIDVRPRAGMSVGYQLSRGAGEEDRKP